MKIDIHISQLLYRFQCVTIPGFGAFLAETISAKVNENNQNFIPPRKVISFNSHLKNNDGLLANHIATCEKTSYDHAVMLIANAVDLWKNELENNNFLQIKNIGNFVVNEDKNLVFTATNDVNYLATSFGLNSFVSPIIKREVLVQIEEKQTETVEYPFEITSDIEEVVEEEPRRYLNAYLKYAAILVVSLGLSGAGYSAYLNQEEQKEIRLVQADVQKEITTKIQEATFFISAPVEDKTVVETPKKLSFHIMAGAFRNENNANRKFKYLLKRGFDAKILDKNESGLLPVIYGSFTTYSEAQNNLSRIQRTQNKEAWLLIKDL